jgi:putative pre-16S rRNA nuclease
LTRLLGLDVGERRIGVALADPDGRAMPLTTLRRNDDPARDGEALAQLMQEHDVAEIVVGLPLDVSGGEGSQAVATRAWVASVEPFLDAPVRYRDERLSSHLAEGRLGPMKRGRSGGPPTRNQRDAWRSRVDREAAAIILQDELDARATDPNPQTEATT